ncbi:MAG: hypothetical protein WD226_03385 [Planctomycetota bacterium]
MSPVLALLVVATLGGGARAQEVPPRTDIVEFLTATTPQELWSRDQRLSFSSASGRRAARVLDEPTTLEEDRRIAWMAVGASGSGAYRSRLVNLALRGTLSERRTAILALGEMGAAGADALERTLAEAPDDVEEYLALAFARTNTEASKKLLVQHSALRKERLHEATQPYVPMVRGGLPPPRPVVVELLEARWAAAKRYGFVDGRRWKDVMTAGLIELEPFVERWISTAAAELERPVADDYLLLMAQRGRANERLVGAAMRLPDRLADLWEAGDWIPDDPSVRRMLVDSIELARNQRAARRLLAMLVAVDPLDKRAQLALLAGGGEVDAVWIERQREGRPEEQAALADALGASGEARWLEDLTELSAPVRALEVRAAALVARVLLGDASAETYLIGALADEETAEAEALVGALTRSAHEPALEPYLGELGDGAALPEIERFRLLYGALEREAEAFPEPLREWLQTPGFAERRLAARALRRVGDDRDRRLFGQVFPVDDDVRLNVELALALAERQDPTVRGLLRAALWREGFARGVLAAGVLVEHYGTEALLEEVGYQGEYATPEHLRRLGVAIAEWTGTSGIERLLLRPGVRREIVEGVTLGSIASIAREQ